jgi:1-acyl-sn-glycerol-3-phosphate acyltransferase
MTLIRQLSFNLCFYGFTFLFCFLGTPCLLLPRPRYLQILLWYFRTVYKIEKYILGLDYEIRGQEYLPTSGSYLVAAKHFSAYETMKLHILFNDPAIIMKAELQSIPLWGWHAKKSDMIFIDRGSREVALRSIANGAVRMKNLSRPIIIFPQGTRVNIDDTIETRPYKFGIMRMYEITNLPIIPLAMDSGVYWSKNAFLKKSGTAVFEFLPPIPAGQDPHVAFTTMRDQIETTSQKLVAEALIKTSSS